jgi:hypothetical protein
MTLKLGRNPSPDDSRDLKFSTFFDVPALAKLVVPKKFDRESLLPASGLGMLGNDQYGDCYWAGSAHEHILATSSVGVGAKFTTAGVLSDYGHATGFNPATGAGDNGTDMRSGAKYRQKTGIIDAKGKRHKIDAYFNVTPGNLTELLVAAYVSIAAGVGIEFPGSAMDQFNAGKPWSVVKGSSVEGGHYIPAIGKETNVELVTWGAYQGMTTGFFTKYNDETHAYINLDALSKTTGKTYDAIDLAGIKLALGALK